ncbi:MAG: hypothetical protein ACYC46_02050 [Acidobacteriaceae bacterium]
MSDDEIAKQIGKAVMEYRDAKVDCSRIEARVEEVFRAYQFAGEQMDSKRGEKKEPSLRDGKVIIGAEAFKFDASELLNESDLASLLRERDAARERMSKARKDLDRKGMAEIG